MSDIALVTLPFPGFYHSWYSEGIDHEEEQWCEYRAEESDSDDAEMRHPEELRFTASELAEMLFDCTSYSTAYQAVAREYVSTFDVVAGDILGLTVPDVRKRWHWKDDGTYTTSDEPYARNSIGLEFESMTSPRFYNFETDRIFAHIPAATVQKLFEISASDNHETLARVLMERHTSYDGFRSFYSNQLSAWTEKPLARWDHNELCSLLLAAIAVKDPSTADRGEESLNWRVYGCVADGETFYTAWSNAVDWQKFEAMRADRRADKEAELRASDPDYAPPAPRCPETPDMFAA